MNIVLILFFCFALVGIGGAFWMLFTKNILHAALGLLLGLISIAAFFAIAGADFLAVAQIVIYVGGILVLLMFGIMFTHKKDRKSLLAGHHNRLSGFLSALGIVGFFTYLIINTDFSQSALLKNQATIQEATTQPIGFKIMTEYVYAFEIAGLLLLVALIAATFIAGKEEK